MIQVELIPTVLTDNMKHTSPFLFFYRSFLTLNALENLKLNLMGLVILFAMTLLSWGETMSPPSLGPFPMGLQLAALSE